MPTQTIWNSLRLVWGSSPTRPLNVGSKWIKPDLSSKLTLFVDVYAQWLIFHIRSSKLFECLLSCNSHGVDASFLS
jgi:hypothetical protein